jgi:glycosyltransferase involved in cell wall biosynthesis
MSTPPLVSVVMPVFNGERFVGDAIDSVLRQTFTDLELVIVDDGSTDRTAHIVASRAKRDSRIVAQRLPTNQGLVAARNACAALARGDFLAVLDADDMSLPDRLERQVAFLRAHPDVGVLGASVQLIDESGRIGRLKTFPSGPGLVAWSMVFFNSLAHSTVMMRRSTWTAVGHYAPEMKYGAEDYDLLVRAMQVTRLENLPEVLVHYRTWPGNTSTRAWDRLEGNSAAIVGTLAASLAARAVSGEEVAALRGLARDDYPKSADMIRRVAGLIVAMTSSFTAQPWLDPEDRAAVRSDAGVKLWLLSALAARRAPRLAAELALTATRISPRSVMRFTAKAWRRLAS